MAEYHLRTIWHIGAPLEDIYADIENSLQWSEWWPSALKVEQVANGNPDGIANIRRYTWQGRLPYHVVFDIRATRIHKLVAIEGTAQGDLSGVGRWEFKRAGTVSIIHFDWHVHSERWWMNLLAPFARALFIHNHSYIMSQGGAALAKRLNAPLVFQSNTDLMEVPLTPRILNWRPGGIAPSMILVAGLGAGAVATVAQMILWWLVEVPVLATLLRDARMTAAILMGDGILASSQIVRWDVLLVATTIHFLLSFVYALIPAQLASRLRTGPSILVGGTYGIGIYILNMYGFTLLFPWFLIARDWVTLAAHLVFGAAMVGWCRLYVSFFGPSTMKDQDPPRNH